MDEEYEDLKEDIQEECSKFGVILSMKIPRPMMSLMVPGLGKVFIEYSSIDESKVAKKALQGRLFDNKTVECTYHDENKYNRNDFEWLFMLDFYKKIRIAGIEPAT